MTKPIRKELIEIATKTIQQERHTLADSGEGLVDTPPHILATLVVIELFSFLQSHISELVEIDEDRIIPLMERYELLYKPTPYEAMSNDIILGGNSDTFKRRIAHILAQNKSRIVKWKEK